VLHSRWSFAATAAATMSPCTSRFFVVALISFALNSFWVWLFTPTSHDAVLAVLPMMLVTLARHLRPQPSLGLRVTRRRSRR
jgi:hypothetical protein